MEVAETLAREESMELTDEPGDRAICQKLFRGARMHTGNAHPVKGSA